MANKKGKTISIFSAKGGVGKTITTLNLAGAFELIDKKVLIIDLDINTGSVAVALNKTFDKTIFSLIEDIETNRYKELTDYITKYDDHIDFLAAPKDPRQARSIDSKYISTIIERARFYYDVVLIDTTHYLNKLNLIMLDKVDLVLHIITNDPFDIKNSSSLFSIFHDLDKENYKVILNDSVHPFKEYFSLFDIKNIIKTNIDYTISSKMFVKNIDKYLMDGSIITLDKKAPHAFSKDFTTLMTIATDILESEGVKNG